MKLIADAGGTKIEWVLIDGDEVMRVVTRGYNAAHARSSLSEILNEDCPLFVERAQGVDEVWFYGAGCVGEVCGSVAQSIAEVFAAGACHVESDMLGAARALCGHSEGIVCILGTGSNSCRYDGEKIVENVSPLGFILGDEGSGAVLGRKLIGMVMKGVFSAEICRRFFARFPQATRPEIIANVYRGERPSAYLASFVPFLAENIDEPEISDFVINEFCRFFKFNISGYERVESLPIHFIGSVASHFAPQLRLAAQTFGYKIGLIERSPIDGLIAWCRQ